MAYATQSDLAIRIKLAGDYTAAEVNSGFIGPAEVSVNGRLGVAFTVPFDPVPPTILELTCKEAERLMLMRAGDRDRAELAEKEVDRIVKGLIDGEVALITGSGTTIWATTTGNFYSTTEDYPNTFNMLESEDQYINEDRLDDEADAR